MGLQESCTFPMESDSWIKTIAIGTILTIFGFLIVPIILVYGYIVRVIRHSLQGSSKPPEFGDWGELFIEGIQAWVIGIIYMIIPFLVAGITIGGSIMAIATGSQSGATAGLAGVTGGLIITFILMLVFGYLATVGIVNFANERRFSAGFDFGVIKNVALNGNYVIAWISSVIVFFVASIIGGILSIIPLLGFIIASVIFFYAYIVAANLWAGGFSTARGR